jgi:hypothetical protein
MQTQELRADPGLPEIGLFMPVQVAQPEIGLFMPVPLAQMPLRLSRVEDVVGAIYTTAG